jgi:hypothetical protein
MPKPVTKQSINDADIPDAVQQIVVAIDPGPSTGWCITTLANANTPPAWFLAGQAPGRDVLTQLSRFLRRISSLQRKEAIVVVEKYILTSGPNGKGSIGAFTCGVIGAIEFLLQELQMQDVILQLPSDRAIVSKDALKRMGMYTRGRVDAISATQHLVSFLVRQEVVHPRDYVVR